MADTTVRFPMKMVTCYAWRFFQFSKNNTIKYSKRGRLHFKYNFKISENFPFRVCLFFSDVIKEREIQSQIIQFIARSGYGHAQLLISKASFICPILSMAY